MILSLCPVFAFAAELTEKGTLDNTYQPGRDGQPSNVGWNFLCSTSKKEENYATISDDSMNYSCASGEQARWYVNGEAFAFDTEKGMTGEITLKLEKTTGRGVDFEVCYGTNKRYFLSVKTDGSNDILCYNTSANATTEGARFTPM